MKKVFILLFSLGFCLANKFASAQNAGITNTSRSPYTRLHSVDLGDVKWTGGFWKERFDICRDSMITNMWHLFKDPHISHAFRNFQIAAGLDTGSHVGPPFMDGDFYKWLEAVAAVYSVTKDPRLDNLMDKVIAVIAKAQRPDGYIHTPVIIAQKNHAVSKKEFQNDLSFEAYNIGHLMTAACIHYRSTGKTSLLKVAEHAAGFLDHYYKNITPQLARTAVCPSHYMGLVELYRTTHKKEYLELVKKLFDLRSQIKNGTDQNQDRIPFRQQTKAVGHAVRANYLYAGAADLFMETGDSSLLRPLKLIWKDVVYRKMYITGGCGALYDGVSPDGTSYHPEEIQEVHQAYGRDYQLPNFTAHDETCANVGNVLWNWRMFQITAQTRYVDVMELALYNSVLSGISLNGKKFLYANPLAYNDKLPFTLRWSKDRVTYIPLSFCCPPNVVRTIAEVNDYAYSLSSKGLWVNLYGSNTLSTKLENGSELSLSEETNYPWDGNITITFQKAPAEAFSVFLRIPGWCQGAGIFINGQLYKSNLSSGSYVEIHRKWQRGDQIHLELPMPVKLIEANPLVEATRNQVAIKRGPMVYCLESTDLSKGQNIFSIAIPSNVQLEPKMIRIDHNDILALEGRAELLHDADWKDRLYRPISTAAPTPVHIQLIPYFAWGNRGHTNMTVWMPLER